MSNEKDKYVRQVRSLGARLVYDDNLSLAAIERAAEAFSPALRTRARYLRHLSRVLQESTVRIDEYVARSTANIVFSDRDPSVYRRNAEKELKEALRRQMVRLRMLPTTTLKRMVDQKIDEPDLVVLMNQHHKDGDVLGDVLFCLPMIPLDERDKSIAVDSYRLSEILRIIRNYHDVSLPKLDDLSDDSVRSLTALTRFMLRRQDSDMMHPELITVIAKRPDQMEDIACYLEDYNISVRDRPDVEHIDAYLNSETTALRVGEL